MNIRLNKLVKINKANILKGRIHMNIRQAKEVVLEMEKALHNLQIISWDEVFEDIPESEQIEDDINSDLGKLRDGIEDLKQFFE